MSIKEMWDAPTVKNQLSLRSLVGATTVSAGIWVALETLALAVQSHSNLLGQYGPIIGAAATLVIAIIHQYGTGMDPRIAFAPEPPKYIHGLHDRDNIAASQKPESLPEGLERRQ